MSDDIVYFLLLVSSVLFGFVIRHGVTSSLWRQFLSTMIGVVLVIFLCGWSGLYSAVIACFTASLIQFTSHEWVSTLDLSSCWILGLMTGYILDRFHIYVIYNYNLFALLTLETSSDSGIRGAIAVKLLASLLAAVTKRTYTLYKIKCMNIHKFSRYY